MLLTCAVLVPFSLWDSALAESGYTGTPGEYVVASCQEVDPMNSYQSCSGTFRSDGQTTSGITLAHADGLYPEGTRLAVRLADGEVREELPGTATLCFGLLFTAALSIAASGLHSAYCAATGEDWALPHALAALALVAIPLILVTLLAALIVTVVS